MYIVNLFVIDIAYFDVYFYSFSTISLHHFILQYAFTSFSVQYGIALSFKFKNAFVAERKGSQQIVFLTFILRKFPLAISHT